MWQVVYIASSSEEAQQIEKKIKAEGFMVQIETAGSGIFQIKVLTSEAEEAYDCLNDIN